MTSIPFIKQTELAVFFKKKKIKIKIKLIHIPFSFLPETGHSHPVGPFPPCHRHFQPVMESMQRCPPFPWALQEKRTESLTETPSATTSLLIIPQQMPEGPGLTAVACPKPRKLYSEKQGQRERGCSRDGANWSKRFCQPEIVALGKLRPKEPCETPSLILALLPQGRQG